MGIVISINQSRSSKRTHFGFQISDFWKFHILQTFKWGFYRRFKNERGYFVSKTYLLPPNQDSKSEERKDNNKYKKGYGAKWHSDGGLKMPNEWRSVGVHIYKDKGDIQSCTNYRGTKLTSLIMKLWERVMEQKLKQNMHFSLPFFGTSKLSKTFRQKL